LEEILARVDAPRLDELHMAFFNQIIFDTPQLFQFISRRPTLMAPEEGHIVFDSKAIVIKFSLQTPASDVLSVEIPCTASEWQLSSLEQVCTSSLPPLSTLEDLYMLEDPNRRPRWQDDVENTLWLDVLRSCVAVKNLCLSKEFVPRISPALQELVGGRTTEVLPALKNISLKGFQSAGPLHKGIKKFVAARRLAGHPVTVSYWERQREREREIEGERERGREMEMEMEMEWESESGWEREGLWFRWEREMERERERERERQREIDNELLVMAGDD